KGLTPLIQMISHAPAPLRATIGVLGVLAAAIGPLIVSLGGMSIALARLTTIGRNLATIFGALARPTGAVTPPTLIAIGAIAAIGTAFVIAYKKSETFRNIVNGALNGVVAGFKMAWGAIKSVGSMIGSFIFTNIIQPIQQFSQKILGEIQ